MPITNWGRFTKKQKKGIFIGYNSIFKGYKIYNIECGIFFISRDVNEDEDSYYDLNISLLRRMDIEPVSKYSNEDLKSREWWKIFY